MNDLAAYVIAAEQSDVTDQRERSDLKEFLRAAARSFIATGDSSWHSPAGAAIRRYASLIHISEVDTLSEFLVKSGDLDTRQVTLQAIRNVLASAPPNRGDLEELRNRVFVEASEIPAELLAPGPIASLFMNLVATMAVLDDPRVGECIEKINAWNRPWLKRQTQLLLRNVVSGWPSDHEATSRLRKAIASLEDGPRQRQLSSNT